MVNGLTASPPNHLTPTSQAVAGTDNGPASPRESSRISCAIRSFLLGALFVMVLFCIFSPSATAQNFGSGKKKVTMRRRLPAAVHFSGTAFDVHVTAHEQSYEEVAQTLSDLLPTELEKDDKRLHVDKNAPDLMVSCVITTYETPPPKTFSRNEVAVQKKSAEAPKQYYKVTGTLTLAYQARDRSSRVIDSQNITSNYSADFEAGTNAEANESFGSKVVDPFKRLAGKKTEETATAPTPLQLRNILISRALAQIAARLVNTDEVIEVPLARGKQLDGADKLAESGLWSRYVETLETMQPFPDPALDAYRLYDIGVGYEAEAYQSEDHVAAKKLLEQAAINYGKALDAKPSEKNFMDPQSRIETAVEHYRALEASAASAAAPPPPPPSAAAANPTPAAAPAPKSGAGTRSASPKSSPGASSRPAASPKSGGSSPTAKAGPPLTNDDVIKMAKAGVDEASIVTTIREAHSVQFDLSPDGLIHLAQNGVKGNIVTAMRERNKRSSNRSSAPTSN